MNAAFTCDQRSGGNKTPMCYLSGGKHKRCYTHGKKAETQQWHTGSKWIKSSWNIHYKKSDKQDQGPKKDAAAPVTLQQSTISDSEFDGNDTQVVQK